MDRKTSILMKDPLVTSYCKTIHSVQLLLATGPDRCQEKKVCMLLQTIMPRPNGSINRLRRLCQVGRHELSPRILLTAQWSIADNEERVPHVFLSVWTEPD
jgi:hypothetical protein